MDDRQQAAELAQLEADLAARVRLEPPAEFRSHVLAGVRSELRADAIRSWWSFGAVTAAAALLCINLSLNAISATDYSRPSWSASLSPDAMLNARRKALKELLKM